jgi:hypothetical protein
MDTLMKISFRTESNAAVGGASKLARQPHMVVLALACALSRTGSFHPGRTKWHVYPFGMRYR